MTIVETARTLLFVPADRPERFSRALAANAGLVIIDLEDAVPPGRKPAGRTAIAALDPTLLNEVAVRINPLGTDAATDDVDQLTSLTGLAAIVVPKAEDPDALTSLHHKLAATPLIALVETGVGLARLGELAAAAGVLRLAFGHLDYAADFGVEPDSPIITHARCEIVVTSRAAGLAAPIDGVTTELDDLAVSATDAAASAALGFGGKLCIHPRQVPVVAEAFRPSPHQLEWARGIVAAADGGASRFGSQMIDGPLVKRARSLLEQGVH